MGLRRYVRPLHIVVSKSLDPADSPRATIALPLAATLCAPERTRRYKMRFILGVVIGAAIGATVGLIVAPQSGRSTREALARRVRQNSDDGAEALATITES
jgi:YtxH-like protein